MEEGMFFDGMPELGITDLNVLEAPSVIQKLLALQSVLMEACGVFELPPDVAYAVTLAAQQSELAESFAWFGDLTKPWKRDLSINLEHQREEAVDKLFFLLQEFNLLGMDAADIVEGYAAKYAKNFLRIIQKNGEANGDLQ